jgi:alpha-L-fucosidase
VINSWHAEYALSVDGGRTWQPHSGGLPGCATCQGCVKNQCITLSDGRVLCPSSDESPAFDSAHMEATDTQFSEFSRLSTLYFFYAKSTNTTCDGIIQPLLYETAPGQVLALFRTQGCGVIAQARSTDGGRTWPLYASETALPNPGAGIGGTRMAGQDDIGLVLAYNSNTRARTPLSLAQSADGGATWQRVADVETDASGSFAYPFVLQSRVRPRTAHLCYTYSRGAFNTIAYAQLQW